MEPSVSCIPPHFTTRLNLWQISFPPPDSAVDSLVGDMYFGNKMNKSQVVVIKGTGVLSRDGEIDTAMVGAMLALGLRHLHDGGDVNEALAQRFSRRDRVGIKINTIGGRRISTRPELSLALADLISGAGVGRNNIVIWDRTNRELRAAGYSLSDRSSGTRVFATDTAGAGYEPELRSHLGIASLFSTIQTNFATASVSLAILKDHGMAGITAGMKNYFGAIHNPNKYHDTHCDPYIAELFDMPAVKEKHRLSILDALLVQYHRGPSFHPRWAESCGRLIFSLDPVAADAVGWRLIEALRTNKGLPSLLEEGRPPSYLKTAENMGLGRSALEDIRITEDEI
jgi:uncharacterized protein (DUF362 family)